MKRDKAFPPEDDLILLEQKAGIQAIEEIIDRHLVRIMEIRKNRPIENLDLLSIELRGNRAIENPLRKDVGRLQEKIKSIVEAVAKRTASRKYRTTEQAVNDIKLAKNAQETFHALLNGDKAVYISCYSLKFTIDLFSKLNNRIIDKLERNGEISDNTQSARDTLLAIAITVYELLDFVVKYVESFKIYGIDELRQIYRNICDMNQKLLKQEEKREKRVHLEEIAPDVREEILKDVKNRRSVLSQLSQEWDAYMRTILRQKEQTDIVSESLPFLRMTRESAKGQVEILQAVSMLRLAKTNLEAIQSSVESLEKIVPIPLSPDKIRNLFGEA